MALNEVNDKLLERRNSPGIELKPDKFRASFSNRRASSTPTNQHSTTSTPSNQRSRSTTKSLDDASNELSTDQSDSTDDDHNDSPVYCDGHDHLDMVLMDDVFGIPVDTLYEMMFGDHDFYKQFQAAKKTRALVMADWSEPDENGDRNRTLTYSIALNYSVGPKSAPTIEKQMKRHMSRPNNMYVVDAECFTPTVPYGDSFYYLSRICMTRSTTETTRCRVTAKIIYNKKVWGIIKSFIEKNVKHGGLESYNLLARLLHGEAEQLRSLSPRVGEKRRRSSNHDAESKTRVEPSLVTSREPQHEINNNRLPGKKKRYKRSAFTKHKQKTERVDDVKLNMDVLAKIMFTLFVLLLFINVGLFYTLGVVQEKANVLVKVKQELHDTARSLDAAGDWQTMLQDQKEKHYMNLDKWRDILSASAQIMGTMHSTLTELQENIDKHKTPFTHQTNTSQMDDS